MANNFLLNGDKIKLIFSIVSCDRSNLPLQLPILVKSLNIKNPHQ